jgi:hypothetical protein
MSDAPILPPDDRGRRHEPPNTVHGRLLEAVHISGYTFERACAELKWLLAEDRWKAVGGGYHDIHAFLSTINFSEFRMAVEKRKEIAKLLQAIEVSQRATARLLGVDHVTIARDLGRGANAPPPIENTPEIEVAHGDPGEHSPPADRPVEDATREGFIDEPLPIPAWFTDPIPTPPADPHVAHNSGNNEWYTPADYLAAARVAMGGIDLDPASSAIANDRVQAAMFYTADQDGLTAPWHGRVWLNPPYAQPLMAHFAEAVADKYDAGEIRQACVLVNNATETAWFQRMFVSAAAICFPRGRVRYLDTAGHPTGAPLQGQAVIYFGPAVGPFRQAFTPFGPVLPVPAIRAVRA